MTTPSQRTVEEMTRDWTAARAARDSGRTGSALNLFAKAAATSVAPCELYYEAGALAADVNRNLAGLDVLYDRHRWSFNLTVGECPARVRGAKLGVEGWEFAVDCLTRASTFHGASVDWHETLAEVLASRSDLRQALLWRQRVKRLDGSRRANRFAVASLYETLGALEDAAREYEELLDTWPDDPESVLGLTWAQERLGRAASPGVTALCQAAMSPASPTDADPLDVVAGRALSIAWAAARRGLTRLSADVPEQLHRLLAALKVRHVRHPTIVLAEGYAALVGGDTSTAHEKFLQTSLATAGGRVLKTGVPAIDGALHDAMNWARVFLVDPGVGHGKSSAPRSAEMARIEWAHAHAMWAEHEFVAAMSAYASALRAHYVTSVPLQYDILGEYKVVLHENVYYAVPRRVEQLTIIDGKVYSLRGRARHLQRRLPPWLIELAYMIGIVGQAFGRQIAALTNRRPVRRLGHAVKASWLRHLAVRVEKLSWQFHRVRGVIVAENRDQLLRLLDRDRRER